METKDKTPVEVQKNIQSISSIEEFLDASELTEQTVVAYMPSQGLKLRYSAFKLSDLSNIFNSTQPKVDIFKLVWKTMDDESKRVFARKDSKPSFELFKRAVSFYDLDFILKEQVKLWGEASYTAECKGEFKNGDICGNKLKFSTDYEKLVHMSDKLTDRITEMDEVGYKPSVWNIEDVEYKLDEHFTLVLGLPSVQKYNTTVRLGDKLDDSLAFLLWKLLHIHEVKITKNDGTVAVLPVDSIKSSLSVMNNILEKYNTVEIDEVIMDNFTDIVEPKLHGTVRCPKCGFANKFKISNLLEELLVKALG